MIYPLMIVQCDQCGAEVEMDRVQSYPEMTEADTRPVFKLPPDWRCRNGKHLCAECAGLKIIDIRVIIDDS